MVNNENNDSDSASPLPNPPTLANPPNPPPNPVPPANPPAHLFKSLTVTEVAYYQLADQNRSQLAQFGLLDSKIDLLISSINVLAEAITVRIMPPDENSLEKETNLRREFMEHDRSAPPPDGEETTSVEELPVLPFTSSSNSRSLTGVKLPRFYSKYTKDVNSWITIIEDQFFLHSTKEKYKVANVSPLLQDDALT